MAATVAIVFIGAIQILCQCPIFIEPNSYNAEIAEATFIARIILTVAILDFLYYTPIYPKCYNKVPRVSRLILEILIATILFEFVMNIIWHRLELVVGDLARDGYTFVGMCPDLYEEWQNTIIGSVTIFISLIVLAHVLTLTDQVQVIPKKWIPEEDSNESSTSQTAK